MVKIMVLIMVLLDINTILLKHQIIKIVRLIQLQMVQLVSRQL